MGQRAARKGDKGVSQQRKGTQNNFEEKKQAQGREGAMLRVSAVPTYLSANTEPKVAWLAINVRLTLGSEHKLLALHHSLFNLNVKLNVLRHHTVQRQ